MSEHTPAPWFAEPLTLVREDVYDVHRWEIRHRPSDDDCQAVALVYSPGFSSDFAPQSEIDANARLIAAAPDLLEALHVLIECCEPDKPHSMLGMARAAVAKAEGV